MPHHLLDIWEVTEPASVAEYQRLARAAIDDILARGRVPLLVGGSGLYVRAVLDEFEFPGTDPALRGRAGGGAGRGRARRRCTPGWPRVDPAAAAGILPSNGRRIVRALEVIELTGRPFTAALPAAERRTTRRCSSGWTWTTPLLDERIARAGGPDVGAGLVAEVRALLAAGCARGGRPAGRSGTSRCCGCSTAS